MILEKCFNKFKKLSKKIKKNNTQKQEKKKMFFAHTTPATTTATLFSFLLLGGVALGANELRINSANDLITFSKSVNNGTNYNGTTVYLDSDIAFDSSLSQQFEPIGNSSNYFQRTFDGQGHTISELTLNSSSEYVGLFCYSLGAVVKNVILDGSCSFVSSYSFTNVDVGRISGFYESQIIENVVSMASITYIGRTDSLIIGGIVGRLVKSCTSRTV